MTQSVMTKVVDEALESRMKSIQYMLIELVEDVEARTINKGELFKRVHSIEQGLRRTRQGF